jgi:hypothetical protein
VRAVVLSFAFAMVPPLAACSAPLVSSEPALRDSGEGAASAALVSVERVVGSDETVHTNAVARFIKMRDGSLDDETLRMLGATLDLPPVGSCDVGDGAETPLEEHGPHAVELLGVGNLAMEAGGASAMLEPRALPDIVDLVTGVLYSTRGETLDALPSKGSYILRSTGSSPSVDAEHSVGGFAIAAMAPGEPGELRVDGDDSSSIALRAGGDSSLSWKAEADSDDAIYVEVVRAGDDGATGRVRCQFADRGTATIPAAAFVTGGSEASHGSLVVHRVHREVFQVPADPAGGRMGIDSGVVRFDFARTIDFTRR